MFVLEIVTQWKMFLTGDQRGAHPPEDLLPLCGQPHSGGSARNHKGNLFWSGSSSHKPRRAFNHRTILVSSCERALYMQKWHFFMLEVLNVCSVNAQGLIPFSTGACGRSTSGHWDPDPRPDPEAHLQPQLHHSGRHGGQHRHGHLGGSEGGPRGRPRRYEKTPTSDERSHSQAFSERHDVTHQAGGRWLWWPSWTWWMLGRTPWMCWWGGSFRSNWAS